MKIALVISTSDAAFNSLAFKGDLVKGLEMAKKIGYDAVEIAIRDPKKVDANEIVKVTKKLGIDVAAVGTGQAFLAEALNLIDPDENLRKNTVERLKNHIDFASHFSCKVIIGFIRGNKKQRSVQEVTKIFVEQMRFLADYAFPKKVVLVIEPLNRYEIDFLNTLHETYEVVQMIGRTNVGILADTFHMNIEEAKIEESIHSIADKLYHFHVADSNRWAPGTGHYDFESTFKALHEINYKGYISVECLPLPNGTEEAAKIAYRTVKKYLENLEGG
ncbi:MAG TPA: 5-keto-L-gluconate epimerase [Pseudothermotoga sp.]|uniref:5-keto-L-gluconate epimerase n=1 Tax=Thermotoga profunda TaxID=1508420 RepID=UPI000596EFB9|nr:5-keto-L-gluconate epimerase [Thermotoga profunda]